jgi:hypothetical protein
MTDGVRAGYRLPGGRLGAGRGECVAAVGVDLCERGDDASS